MENLFIQSFMDTDGKTFLEVGKGEKFTSVPSEFNVTMNGTCFITITPANLLKLASSWNVTKTIIQAELQKQFKDTTIIFDVTI